MTAKKVFPPSDGSVTALPGSVDFHAEHNPSLPCYAFPSHTDPTVPTYVSYAAFAEATHRAAHAARPGRQGSDNEVVAILANCDVLVYHTLIVGLTRAGIIPFPMSPRNSPEAVFSMLEKTACHRVISQPSMSGLVTSVSAICEAKGYALQVDNLPHLKELYPTYNCPQPNSLYPVGDRAPQPEDVVMYLHSSGSTGFPKPIPQTQKVMLQWLYAESILDMRKQDARWFSGLVPPFHTLGIYLQLLASLMSTQPVILFTPKDPEPPVIPNPQNSLDTARAMGASAISAVPAFIEAWANSDDSVKYLATLKNLRFSGGPLSVENSQRLIDAGVSLVAVYGSTEMGAHGLSGDHRKFGWEWLKFSSTVKCSWVPQGDGTYELHSLTCETHQPAIVNLPDREGYATSDLFEPHPTEKDLWRIVGRTDDVIVLGSGEKIVPIPQERILTAVPFVAGVVMFGRGRTQPGVLIEPVPGHTVTPGDDAGLIGFREKIWPKVEEANKTAPSFARLFKEMIIVADPAKPMPRAGKGTVQRKQALTVYSKEIDELYHTINQSTDANGIQPPTFWDAEQVEKWLLQHAKAIMTGDKTVSPSADLFEQGFDSLSATYLRNRIIGALRTSDDSVVRAAAVHVPQDLVFSHPTLQKLSSAVVGLIHPESADSEAQFKEDGPFIERMIAKYSLDLPTFKTGKDVPGSDVVVLLTGSTGNLGSHILASLLAEKRVKRVYTLNRSSSRQDRQRDSFVDSGLSVELLDSKILHSLVGDITRPSLGLDLEIFAEIQSSVTHIIHNAWRLDFNLSLSSFEGFVASSRNLIDICARCDKPTKFFFTSSVAAAQNWDSAKGPVPEAVSQDANVAVGMGYGASKYVVERLLSVAAAKGLGSTVFRIGQIGGTPPTGAWNTTDWVPIIVKSGQTLGCLPSADDDAAWITMGTAAHTITDVVVSVTGEPNPPVINLVHPRPVTWASVFRSISEALSQPVPLVPFPEWLARVDKASSDSSASNLSDIPAIKILRFLQGVASSGKQQPYSNTVGQRVSPALRHAPLIDAETAQSWVGYWRRKGLLM